MTHKNSAGRKRDDLKTLNCTSSTVQKLRFGVKRKLFESSFQTKKNERIWIYMEKVMIKFVSKGQIYQKYVNQRFQVLLWQFGYGFCTSLSS